MTTYKYSEIRRDIFENCSNKSLKKYRSFSDMKRLFKKSLCLSSKNVSKRAPKMLAPSAQLNFLV